MSLSSCPLSVCLFSFPAHTHTACIITLSSPPSLCYLISLCMLLFPANLFSMCVFPSAFILSMHMSVCVCVCVCVCTCNLFIYRKLFPPLGCESCSMIQICRVTVTPAQQSNRNFSQCPTLFGGCEKQNGSLYWLHYWWK